MTREQEQRPTSESSVERSDLGEEKLDLANILAIWPIVESLARHTAVSDLISLGRASPSLRSSLHAQVSTGKSPRRRSMSQTETVLNPQIGKHQTPDWMYLKSIAPFTCSSPVHTRGQEIKACVYCSRPICDACIVRDSFKRPNEHTFKNRLRYFCKDCWSAGNPTRSYRYPASRVDHDGTMLATQPELEDESALYCSCNLKDNGWLCLDCKEEQNTSVLAIPKLLADPTRKPTQSIPCHGLDCDNTIDLDDPERDRFRVCLWCQKPARRHYGFEDRYAWNHKTIQARARNAELRSREIEEYNRNRLNSMRMTRRELRGSPATSISHDNDDDPIFVRHLDVFNYRNFMPQTATPDPESVYRSKTGYWRYSRAFLTSFNHRCKHVKFTHINSVPVEQISQTTQDGALAHARLNREMDPMTEKGARVPEIPVRGRSADHARRLNELRTRVLDLLLTKEMGVDRIVEALGDEYGVECGVDEIQMRMSRWLGRRRVVPSGTGSEDRAGNDDDEIADVDVDSLTLEDGGSRNGSNVVDEGYEVDAVDTLDSPPPPPLPPPPMLQTNTLMSDDSLVATTMSNMHDAPPEPDDPPPYAF